MSFKSLKNHISSSGKHTFLIYSGNTGVGKSRLFYEFKKYCRLNDITFIEAVCIEGIRRDYYSISEIVSQLIPVSSDFILDRYGKYLKLLVPDNILLSHYEFFKDIENPKVLQDIIIQNVSDFIMAVANKFGKNNTIIYFDDMQWIDDGSLLIIKNILRKEQIKKDKTRNLLFCANIDGFVKSPYAALCCTPISLRRIIIRLIHRCLHVLPLELFGVPSQYFVLLRKHHI